MKTASPDVIVIGSGAGGGAAAWRLAQQGVRVLVLEAGPRFDPTQDYKQDRPDWETPFPTKEGSTAPYVAAPLQELGPEITDIRSWSRVGGPYVTGDQRANFGYHHVRGLGGSSLQFTGEAHRMNPRAMALQSDFGVAADWPVTYDALEPYWTLAERIVGVAGHDGDPRCPRAQPYPLPEHPISYASDALAKGARRLGFAPQPNALAALSRPYDERPPCNYCGGCLRGCQRRDKGSIDVTYLRKAVATGYCQIETGVEALKLLTNGSRVEGVLVARGGAQDVCEARSFVLAAGAIQSPRLLLNSDSAQSPDGLCNESGQVGRNFMETLLSTTSALHPDALGSHRGLPVDWVMWDFNDPDAIPGVIGGCRFGPAMAESDLVGPVAYATRIIDGWGADHKRAMRANFGRVLSIAGIGESLPNARSFVDLAEQVDGHGLPVAQIHSHLDPMALARLRFMLETGRTIIEAAGCSALVEEFSSADAFSSTHVFGTCRMGHDPATSVVDAFCRSHRWRNLVIADGSVFPSSGGGESPGLTIQALALRAMDALMGDRP